MALSLKYEILRGSSVSVLGSPVYRIRATRPIPEHGVRAGDVGGFVQNEFNLSREGSSWIANDAMAVGQSRVEDDALARNNAILSDHAVISGQAQLRDFSRANGHAIIRDRAQLSDLVHATGNTIVEGSIEITGGALLASDDYYSKPNDIPWSFRRDQGTRFKEHLTEALSIDETLQSAFRLLGADTPAQRLSALSELADEPEGVKALERLVSLCGGTFHPNAYLPMDALTISAENSAQVLNFCINHAPRNYQAICSIHPAPVLSADTGNPWYAGVIRLCPANKQSLYVPALLEDVNRENSIAALPLRLTPAQGQFASVLDAEAAAMDRLADLSITSRDRTSRSDPITTDTSPLPLITACKESPDGAQMFVTQNNRHASLQISSDCMTDVDLLEITRFQDFTWRPSQLVAVSNPYYLTLELPVPSPELRKALYRAERAHPNEGFTIMKRDMDLVRSLLLNIEANENINGKYVISDNDFGNLGADRNQIQYHLRLLLDAGYIEGRDLLADAKERGHTDPLSMMKDQGAPIMVERLSWDGHEFLDTVRDNKVWQKTKGYLKDIGGVGIDVVKDVAKAVVKDQIQQHTGLSM